MKAAIRYLEAYFVYPQRQVNCMQLAAEFGIQSLAVVRQWTTIMASEEIEASKFLKDKEAGINVADDEKRLNSSDTTCGFSIFRGPALQRYIIQCSLSSFL